MSDKTKKIDQTPDTKKTALTDQDLEKVAGGMRKPGANTGNGKDNNTETRNKPK